MVVRVTVAEVKAMVTALPASECVHPPIRYLKLLECLLRAAGEQPACRVCHSHFGWTGGAAGGKGGGENAEKLFQKAWLTILFILTLIG